VLGFKPVGPRPFEHRAHVLEGIGCNDCHSGITTAGDDSPLHLPDTATCVSCHKEPHDRRDCSNCHGLELTRAAAGEAREHIVFSHETHLPKVDNNCVRCHAGIGGDAETLRPPMATCFGCHEHSEQWDSRDCDACHVDLPSELTRPANHVIHDGDWLREHGVRAASSDLCGSCHTETFCASCHGVTAVVLPERLDFDAVMRAGVHRAGFMSRHAEESRGDPGMCSTCHTEDSCARCHIERNTSAVVAEARSPHGAGWLGPPGGANEHGRAAWRNPAECASCHGGGGESMCVSCHKVGGIGGNPHPTGWSSRMSKRDVPCVLCHGGAL
jgi:hypothetical protein